MISKIKMQRFIKGLTQDEIFLRTKIPQSRLERGYSYPNEKEKKALAEALDCTPEELFS
jgi:transcriptional regulator with XRE-family HTH domain